MQVYLLCTFTGRGRHAGSLLFFSALAGPPSPSTEHHATAGATGFRDRGSENSTCA